MRHLLTLCHPDTVSGTSILDDGTKVYWTEGYSEAVIVHSDGRTERVDAHKPHPILEAIAEMDAMRAMTKAEIAEWRTARQ